MTDHMQKALLERQWEAKMGKDPAQRTQKLGFESNDYRKMVNLPPVRREQMDIQNRHIHQLGADALKTQYDEEKEIAMERAAIEKKKQNVAKILRRKIKVADLDDGGVSVSIDQEWDTSTWSDELVLAGCEALVYIFFDSSERTSEERKERAVQMLQKLLHRHEAAALYMRKNIEALVGKAANKQMRGGRCMGLMDLFYVLRSCKESFAEELSRANFCGRTLEALLQEARLAAILIQHSYRSHRSNISSSNSSSRKRIVPRHEGFGSERDIISARAAVVNSRSAELRTRWRSMRALIRSRVLQQPGGVRGPIHIGAKYAAVALDVLLHLVSPLCAQFAHGNREDVVNTNGCILLSTFLAATMGPFAYQAAVILGNVAKAASSFEHILFSGCTQSALRLLRHLRMFLEVGKRAPSAGDGRRGKITPHGAYLSCVDLIYHTALHAAGLYRASRGYRTSTPAQEEVEKTDYSQLLRFLKAPGSLPGDVIRYLGDPQLLQELSAMILRTNLPDLLSSLLRCFLALLSGNAHYPAAVEITALSGQLMIRLLELAHSSSSSSSGRSNINSNSNSNSVSQPPIVGTLALAVYMQLCTQFLSRQQLALANIEKYFQHTREVLVGQYGNLGFQRGILLTAALCRQAEWRAYDPVQLLQDLRPEEDADCFRRLLLLDLLRTLKCTRLGDDAVAERFQIVDFVVLPTDAQAAEALSMSAGTFGAKAIVDFLVRPEHEFFYEQLPLHEAAASCAIIAGLAADADTALRCCSPAVFNFLSRFVYLCKYLFLGKTMLNSQITVLLNGVQSALVALGRFSACVHINSSSKSISSKCISSKSNLNSSGSDNYNLRLVDGMVRVIKKTELLQSALFFMKTLSVAHPQLHRDTLLLQQEVGCGALDFFNQYAALLAHVEGRCSSSSLRDLYPPGKATVDLVHFLKVVHGKGPFVVRVFAKACELLQRCTTTSEATFLAIQEWKVIDSLRVYLPSPLSGILPEEIAAASQKPQPSLYDSGSEDATDHLQLEEAAATTSAAVEEYKVGLMQLPPAFFQLCANLCAAKSGKEACFAQGFLRRALDKITVLNSTFLRHNTQFLHHGDLEKQQQWALLSLDLVACLRLVGSNANFSDKRIGATNDLILHELYGTVALCKNAVCWKLHSRQPRTDELLLVAYETLAELAQDSYRISALFERYDIFSVVAIELAMLDSLPERGARAAVRLVHRSCFGLTSDYVMRLIPKLREPLTRAARVYPSLHDLVKETQWTLSKCSMVYKKSTGKAQFAAPDAEHEEYVRSGVSPLRGTSNRSFSFSHSALNSADTYDGEGLSTADAAAVAATPSKQLYGRPFRMDAKRSSNGSSSKQLDQPSIDRSSVEFADSVDAASAALDGDDGSEEVSVAEQSLAKTNAGSYRHCGVSNCGSLRLQDAPHQHGEHGALTEQQQQHRELHVAFSDADAALGLTKLSARSPQLRARVAESKGKMGFSPLVTIDVAGTHSSNINSSDNNSNKNRPELQLQLQEPMNQRDKHKADTFTAMARTKDAATAKGSATFSPNKKLSRSGKLGFSSFSAPSTPVTPSAATSQSAAVLGQQQQQLKMRCVSVQELPQLMLTRPPAPLKSKKQT